MSVSYDRVGACMLVKMRLLSAVQPTDGAPTRNNAGENAVTSMYSTAMTPSGG